MEASSSKNVCSAGTFHLETLRADGLIPRAFSRSRDEYGWGTRGVLVGSMSRSRGVLCRAGRVGATPSNDVSYGL